MMLRIHETFQKTIQGEGYWAGTPCDFIRLYGCPVGCPWCDSLYSPADGGGKKAPRVERDVESLVDEVVSKHVVVTGGEPYAQPLGELIGALRDAEKRVHIETSGSIWQRLPNNIWITLSPKEHVSPKYPVQPEFWNAANEVKIIVADGTEYDFYRSRIPFDKPTFVQPEWYQHQQAVDACMKILEENPHVRLSLQTHKFIGVL